MKELTLLLIFTVFYQIGYAKRLNVAGQYVDKDYDTVYCRFKIPLFKDHKDIYHIDYSILQKRVKAVLDDKSREILKPDEIISYSFYYNYGQYDMLTVNDNMRTLSFHKKDPKLFLKLECNGLINLFSYYKKRSFPPYPLHASLRVTTLSFRYYLQKEDSEIIKLNKRTFRQELESWFSDCPSFKRRITEDYTSINLHGIVKEYNECIVNE